MHSRRTIRVSSKFNICITQRVEDDTNPEWIRERVEFTERVLSVILPQLGINPHVRIVFDFLKSYHAFQTSMSRVGNTSKQYMVIDPRIFDPDQKVTGKMWFMNILCHELIHVEQIEKKWCRFVDTLSRKKIFRGYWYGQKYEYDLNDGDGYLNAPWEIDAYARMKTLAALYLQSELGKVEPENWSDWYVEL